MISDESKALLTQFTMGRIKDAVFWITRDGAIHHVNESACERLEYSYEELTSMHILEINKQIDPVGMERIFDEIKENGGQVMESVHYTKSGKGIPVEISTNFISHQNQEYTCSIVRDISDRKRKEAALRGALMEIRSLKEKLEAENNYLQEEIKLENNYDEIISKSERFKLVLHQVEQVANTDSTVLVTGESGTGKELISRVLHRLSKRSRQAMIKVNCAALPANLIESELFGHEKGAFTGAINTKLGRFELANRGTLFLDEIGELPLELQAKLLRAIQEGEIERLGGKGPIKVNVRIIAATNRKLEEEVRKGNFRSDLYYRLHVFPINLPPLRERIEDIPLLIHHFCQKHGPRIGKTITNIPQKVIQQLQQYPFPGNIRELENIIERAIIISRDGILSLGNWLSALEWPKSLPDEETNIHTNPELLPLDEIQRRHIIMVLKHTNWKVSGKSGAAEILDMRPTTLESRMKKLGIRRSKEAM